MDLGLAGAKAIVTGGSRGIGRAVAQTLGGEGVAVAICARGREGLDRAVTELRSHGVDVRGQVLDVSDETAIPGFVDWAARRVRRAGHQRLQRLQRLRGRQRRARPVGGELRVRLAGVRPAGRGGGATTSATAARTTTSAVATAASGGRWADVIAVLGTVPRRRARPGPHRPAPRGGHRRRPDREARRHLHQPHPGAGPPRPARQASRPEGPTRHRRADPEHPGDRNQPGTP